MSRRRIGRTSGQERVPLPHPLVWAVLTVALIGLAAVPLGVTIAAGLGHKVPKDLESVLAVGSVRSYVPAVLIVAALIPLRRALLARLARRPGPVEIVSVLPGGESQEVADRVVADFRQVLTTMSLTAPRAVPATPTSDSLLDDVRTATSSSTNSVATAAGILRAVIQVRCAYRVAVQLRSHEGARPCGMTIDVGVLPGSHGAVETLWAEDWASVAEAAAHVVGAFILTRSKLSRRSPWRAWRGLAMPWELFHHSQLARRHVQDREYEQALGAYYSALKLDPQNPYLRIEMGQVQEQLGLVMDALATFADVVAIESWYDRRLWRRLRHLLNDDTGEQPPPRSGRRPNGRDALLIARYRLVGRLAAADDLVGQWNQTAKSSDNTSLSRRRAAELRALRKRIIIWLRSYARGHGRVYDLDLDVDQEHSTERMRHLFQYVGYVEAMHLVDDYRWGNGRRRPGMPVTQTSLYIMRIWARLYMDLSSRALGLPSRFGGVPTAESLGRQISRELNRKPAWARDWQEYYNAACTCAVALMFETVERTAEATPASSEVDHNRKKLVYRTIRHLERAVSRTDSSYVGTYAQWLSTGDEDLNPLRSTAQFIDFLDRYLPNEEPRVLRPSRKLIRLVMSLHTVRISQTYASGRAAFWGEQTVARAGQITESELGFEPHARDVMLQLAANFVDWRSRLALVDETLAFGRRTGREVRPARLPQFQDDPSVRHYSRNGPVIDGQAYGYPDAYFREVVRRRDRVWPMIVQEIKAADGRGGATPRSSLGLWSRVEEMLRNVDPESTPSRPGRARDVA